MEEICHKNMVIDISPTMCVSTSTELEAFVLLIQQPRTQPSSVCAFDLRVGSNGIKVEDEYLDSVLGVRASQLHFDIL